MKIFPLVLLALLPSAAFSAFNTPEDVQGELNTSPFGQRVQLGTQLISKKEQVLEAYYDFNRQGGDTATKMLLDAKDMKVAAIPAGAIVSGCAIHVLEPITSPGSPTIALSTGQSVDDLKGQTAKTSLSTSDSLVACDLTEGSVASWQKMGGYTDQYSRSATAGYKLTQSYTPTIKIKGGTVTGGKLAVYIKYLINR